MMNTTLFIVLAILFLALISWYVLGPKFQVKLQVNRKFVYLLVAAYVVVLLIATFTAELYEKKYASQMLEFVEDSPIIEGSYVEDYDSVDTLSIIEKREHAVSGKLKLLQPIDDYLNYADILIERKDVNDGIIEETIYKPTLVHNGFDFSDQYLYALPEWKLDTVVFLAPPETTINYSTYRDSFLLSQFEKNKRANPNSWYGSSSTIKVHLLVPKDLEIEASDLLYIQYTNN
ncbi:hypothetical protein ACXYMX_03140 [Sporosarcina sp. CAU 1771]